MTYKYKHFIPENIAPAKAKKIVAYKRNGDKVCDISLGRLKQPAQSKQYSFLAISDVHITYNTAATDFQRALTYAESNCDFTCICGDLTGEGTASELAQYKAVVNSYAITKPVYAMAGNHEFHSSYNIIDQYTGYPLYYSFNKGDDVFIMVGYYGADWKPNTIVSLEELQWLYRTLEENRNKRCFVFVHVYPYEDGIGDANRFYNGKYWSTQDAYVGQALISLLKHYKNTILFHGHSHLRFYLQELDKKANYSSEVGYRSVHIPSLAVPRDRVENETKYIYAESEGYVVDVYDNYIILNGRDFIDNDKDGHILPIATYKIDTPLQTVEAKTFIDTTGIIITNKSSV